MHICVYYKLSCTKSLCLQFHVTNHNTKIFAPDETAEASGDSKHSFQVGLQWVQPESRSSHGTAQRKFNYPIFCFGIYMLRCHLEKSTNENETIDRLPSLIGFCEYKKNDLEEFNCIGSPSKFTNKWYISRNCSSAAPGTYRLSVVLFLR